MYLKYSLKMYCICAVSAFLIFSCKTEVKNTGEFALLPLPQKFEITGASDFDCSNVQRYFNTLKDGCLFLMNN